MKNHQYLDRQIRSQDQVKADQIDALKTEILETKETVDGLQATRKDLISQIEALNDKLSETQYLIARNNTENFDRLRKLQELVGVEQPGAEE